DQASALLWDWREAFAKVLIADLNLPEKTGEFADMVAQTLAYGLFTARIMDKTPDTFSRFEAQRLIPKSNPLLRDFFGRITGIDMDDEPFAPFFDDLVNLLAHTDMEAVLTDFGKRTRQEDPVVHFYETFLAAYDPKLREARGVYYTPEPVVSYIVRSVDYLLKTRFNCPQGLADSSKITIPNTNPGLTIKGKRQPRKTTESHKVLVLDPATGTGTFLYSVIDHIRQQFMQQGNAGLWPGYVKNHLLPRLFGFELLMAPYAVAHFKLSLQLMGRDLPEPLSQQWTYTPTDSERLGIYLTNTLEEPHEMTGLPLFTQWVADETNAANEIKQLLPVLVVMGNPPYSNFGMMNKGDWILDQLNDYKKGLDEKKINLDDDFIKFIRFGQWRIDKSGVGILAFITNNTYIDGITHRRMRQSLMETFTEIYILNLHGSSMKEEVSPDGSKDDNVFDIRQGVCISLFVKELNKQSPAKVYYSELWGARENKYATLFDSDFVTTPWVEITPKAKYFFFTNKNFEYEKVYKQFNQITECFSVYSSGIQTKRDKVAVTLTEDNLNNILNDFLTINDEELRAKYKLPQDGRDWKISWAKEHASEFLRKGQSPASIFYRPFDNRWCIIEDRSKGFVAYPRFDVMHHMKKDNLGLITTRQLSMSTFQHVCATRHPIDGNTISIKTREYNYLFPLYIYPNENDDKQKSLFEVSDWPPDEANGKRTPNLNPAFVEELEQKLGLAFQPHPAASTPQNDVFTPEVIFHYIYAIFHSPTYRSRYAEFLKIDFPRVPVTSDVDLFRSLSRLGQQLVSLHLLESPEVSQFITRYPIAGDNQVEKGYPKYVSPQEGHPGRVMINKTQYFEGVPSEVWEFYIGGYQVLDKWLKDRRGRQLSYDDLTHYQQVVVALQKTIDLMTAIDAAIPEWPIQ
ncbi:MAG: DNA methyltransferase, partial [Anaerolineae bacterium]|nr:DNA methyltransferase [Anaerolineae bacterium]